MSVWPIVCARQTTLYAYFWVSDTLTTLCNIFWLPGRLTCVPGRPLGYRFVLTWILDLCLKKVFVRQTLQNINLRLDLLVISHNRIVCVPLMETRYIGRVWPASAWSGGTLTITEVGAIKRPPEARDTMLSDICWMNKYRNKLSMLIGPLSNLWVVAQSRCCCDGGQVQRCGDPE